MQVQVPAGVTAVSSVAFFPDAARAGTPETRTATLAGTTVTFDPTALPPARYWPRVIGTGPTGAVTFDLPHMDLPEDPRLVITPEALAASARMPLPLSADDRETIVDVILDAQADIVAYLGQPILPQTFTQHGLWDIGTDWELWRYTELPIVRVLSAEAEREPDGYPTGTFTVVYVAGIDAREDQYRPIRRYLVAHAKNSIEFTAIWKRVTKARGAVKSLSAEGQSVSFGEATLGAGASKPGDNTPGALPAASSMDYWRISGRRVYQGRTHFGDRYGL